MVPFGLVACGSGLWLWGPSRVLRLDPRSGRVLDEFAGDPRFGELTGAVLVAGRLLAATADGHLVRFAPGGRKGRWLRTRGGLPLVAAELHTAADGRAIASARGSVVAVDEATGRVLWRRLLGFRIGTVLDAGGVLLVQGAAFRDPGDRIWALDPATGRILATTTLPAFSTTSMTIAGGSLWVATGAGEVIVVPPLVTRMFLQRARAGRS